MRLRSIVAVGVIIGALLWCWSAWALPAGASFTFLETWDEYGTQSTVPAIAPYVLIDPSTSSIVSGQTVPWTLPGSNVTGSYLKIVPNCDSSNPQGARGTDQTYLVLQSSGKLQLKNSANTNLGNSGAFKLTFGSGLTNWFLFETITTVGVNSQTAWAQGSITINVYKSNGLRIDSFGCNNCATNANNNSLLIDQIAYDAEFDDSIVEDFGLTWVINPGTNGIAAFVGPQRSAYTSPSGDSTPLQYAVTGVTHHWQAVSNVPLDSTKYVSTATQGNRDEYSANVPHNFGTITEQALVSFQVSDGTAVRLGTDLTVGPGGVTTLGNQCALISSARPFCESFYSNTSMPTKIGLELGW